MVAPMGRLDAAGTAESPLSLGRAVAMAPAGAVIRLAAGSYLTPGVTIDRPMTIEAEPGATVEFRGSTDVPSSQWERSGSGWRTPWTAATLEAQASTVSSRAPSISDRAAIRQQRVAIDGKALRPALSAGAVAPGSFFVDTLGKWLYVGQDPALHSVQTGGADIGILVTGPNVSVIGIGVHGFSSIGLRVAGSATKVESADISYNSLIGLDVNGASNMLVENSRMTYNGQVGLEASHSSYVTIQSNNISNNNTGNYDVTQEAAGLKGTNVSYITVRNNWMADNAANTLWFDVASSNITVAGNQVLRSKCYGIYFELANQVLVVGNVAHDNKQQGIGVHFTTNARLYNNTLVNNGGGVDVSASYNRSPYDTYHAVIVNNIIWSAGSSAVMANLYRYNGCNSYVYSQIDYNAYFRESTSAPRYDMNWCNTWYGSISAFHSGTGNEAHGVEVSGGTDPFFVNVNAENYHLKSGSPAYRRGVGLPADAAAALGVSAGVTVSMGAMQY